MNRVSVWDRTGKSPMLVPTLRRCLQKALGELRLKNVDMSVVLVSNPAIQKLNRRYRGFNHPTDVLAFSQNGLQPDSRRMLGDVVIATPTARAQAKTQEHSVEREFCLLALHGLLHLLGHDHGKKRDARRMFRLQDRLLEQVGPAS